MNCSRFFSDRWSNRKAKSIPHYYPRTRPSTPSSEKGHCGCCRVDNKRLFKQQCEKCRGFMALWSYSRKQIWRGGSKRKKKVETSWSFAIASGLFTVCFFCFDICANCANCIVFQQGGKAYSGQRHTTCLWHISSCFPPKQLVCIKLCRPHCLRTMLATP